jgi:integrase
MMTWDEVAKPGEWVILGGRMKRGRDHVVPLSTQAQEVLAEMKRRARPGRRWVWPGDRTDERPMSENAVLYLLHRIGYKDKMTGHGWRSTASTWATEAGYSPDAIERQLAHAPNDKVRSAYNRAAYMPERRQMLQAWADWLDAQLSCK